jgi:hypothetical protein
VVASLTWLLPNSRILHSWRSLHIMTPEFRRFVISELHKLTIPYLRLSDSRLPRFFDLKDRYGEPERGEWMGVNKNTSWRRWRLQQDEHDFQHTSSTHYPSWTRPRSHWSATGPRNQQPTSQTRERSGTQDSSLTDLHRSGPWAPPVRPVPAGETWQLP